MLYQAKLPHDLARRLKAGMNNPGFRALFDDFLQTELIDLAEFPQLRQLCWNLKTEFLTRTDAFALYERNWRFIDQSELTVDVHYPEHSQHYAKEDNSKCDEPYDNSTLTEHSQRERHLHNYKNNQKLTTTK